MSEHICAVWYVNWQGQIDYDLGDTEQEAAQMAAALSDQWQDYPREILGVQFSDGSTIPAEQWQPFLDARRAYSERQRQAWRNPPPPRPTHRTKDPFLGKPIDIEDSEPDWLGAPGE